VNCSRLSLLAASRTRCSPPNALPQLCVWDAVVCSVFSLVDRLPSAPSADGFPPLFGRFAGTTRPSDSPQRSCWTCGSSSSPTGPLTSSCRALVGPPGSRARSFHTCRGLRPRRVQHVLAISHLLVLPSAFRYGVGTLIFENYAAQYRTRMCPYQCFTSSLATGHAHDSGPVWVAGPSPYGSFIRTSTPVYPGAHPNISPIKT
jgi:hypothetical protein